MRMLGRLRAAIFNVSGFPSGQAILDTYRAVIPAVSLNLGAE